MAATRGPPIGTRWNERVGIQGRVSWIGGRRRAAGRNVEMTSRSNSSGQVVNDGNSPASYERREPLEQEERSQVAVCVGSARSISCRSYENVYRPQGRAVRAYSVAPGVRRSRTPRGRAGLAPTCSVGCSADTQLGAVVAVVSRTYDNRRRRTATARRTTRATWWRSRRRQIDSTRRRTGPAQEQWHRRGGKALQTTRRIV